LSVIKALTGFFIGMGAILLVPAVILLVAWRHERAGRHDRALGPATLGRVFAGMLLGLEAPLVLFFLLEGNSLWKEPVTMALVSYPPLLWVLADLLNRSIARRREEDRARWRARREEERRPGPGEAG
jgi:hypothetical protein